MTSFTMYQIDAFADRPFAGNPAAVLILDRPMNTALMAAIAAENNLAETAFVQRDGGDYAIRWFTPTSEVAFCGHATLAAAHVLAQAYGCAMPVRFQTREVGSLVVGRHPDGRYALDLPRLDPAPLPPPPQFAQIFPQGWIETFQSFENYFVLLPSAKAVADFTPDLRKIAEFGDFGLAITAAGGMTHQGAPVDFVSRYFAPGAGIDEDPVTGSTHATLVPFWAKRLGMSDLTAFQASKRGGAMGCRLTDTRVILSARAVTFMKATIYPG